MTDSSLEMPDYGQNFSLHESELNHTQMDPEQELFRKFEHVFSTIFGGFGISVTCFILYVFKKQRQIAPTERLIIGLLTAQLLYNICYVGVMTFSTISYTESLLSQNGLWMKVFNSVNYFLFAFCVISSYVLLFAVTVCRYYAVCHFERFRYWFSKRRCNRYMLIGYGAGFIQGSLNASYDWVPSWAQVMEDTIFAVVLMLFLIIDFTVMTIVYRKIMDRIECVHQKLSSNTTMTQVLDTPIKQRDPLGKLPEKPRSKSMMATTGSVKFKVESSPKVEISDSKSKPSMIASPSTDDNNESNRQTLFTPANSHYSKQVSVSLLWIKVLFIICVTPWTLNFIAACFLEMRNIYVNLFCNLLLQLNYVLNPIVYLCRNATLKTKAAVVCGLSAPKPKPGRGHISEK